MDVPKQVAVALFYNSEGEILLQDRRARSKWGEEYGLFGGIVEDGETPEQAIRRELKEELGLEKVELRLFKKYLHQNPVSGVMVERSVYLSPMPNLTTLVCYDGKAEVRRFKNSLNLKLIPGLDMPIKEIYESLKSKSFFRFTMP